MKKSDATHSAEILSAALGGLDATLPGTRPDLRDETAAFAEHLSPLLSRLPEAAPPEGLFDMIEAEIDGAESAPFQSVRAEEGVWEQRSEKVWKKVLAQETETGRSMYLLRCLPGASIKPHIHERAEHLFILEGELWIEGKLYSAGDAQVAKPGSVHPEIAMPTGCLVLVSA
ncbi:cupin domain-containing protein [uncultured Tateyamaria sp.]|uniref:cupin domain-containing protein n=1 Tax=uncultured Tateyamaria sp. TaxID=455651 RepID=UPI0026326B77|nr:cupin domain-containing protein [uncultured Tateyamaria sp.]